MISVPSVAKKTMGHGVLKEHGEARAATRQGWGCRSIHQQERETDGTGPLDPTSANRRRLAVARVHAVRKKAFHRSELSIRFFKAGQRWYNASGVLGGALLARPPGDLNRYTAHQLMNQRRRMRYSLSFLLLAVTLVAIVVGYFAREIDGRICRKSDTLSKFDVDFAKSPFSPVAVQSPTETAADELFDLIDVQCCGARAVELYVADNPESPYFSQGTFIAGKADRTVFVKFDFDRWGRYRLDLRRLKYIFDPADPVASQRNDAIERSYIKAANEQLNQRRVKDREETGGELVSQRRAV